jgi:Transposase, Mutator family
MGTCVHFSRSLPSNSWWQTMVGWHVLSRPSAAEGGGRRPAFTGLATSHTRPPRSTAGNINSAGRLKTGPQYTLLVASAVNSEGFREILGICEGAKEDKSGWSACLRHLVDRGLKGVQLVISDACRGLMESAAEYLPEAR